MDETGHSGVVAQHSLDEFWGAYLAAHRSPLNRWLHVVGTVLSVGVAIAAVVTQSWWWLLLAAVVGYAPAWVGHAFVEHNRPLTATAPLRSLICDYRLTLLMLSGRPPAPNPAPEPMPPALPREMT
ncbi:MAG: Mpo1-like protein [Planctomycetaceae bacterium]